MQNAYFQFFAIVLLGVSSCEEAHQRSLNSTQKTTTETEDPPGYWAQTTATAPKGEEIVIRLGNDYVTFLENSLTQDADVQLASRMDVPANEITATLGSTSSTILEVTVYDKKTKTIHGSDVFDEGYLATLEVTGEQASTDIDQLAMVVVANPGTADEETRVIGSEGFHESTALNQTGASTITIALSLTHVVVYVVPRDVLPTTIIISSTASDLISSGGSSVDTSIGDSGSGGGSDSGSGGSGSGSLGLHLAYQEPRPNTYATGTPVGYLYWNGSHWQRTENLFGEQKEHGPVSIARSDDGRIFVFKPEAGNYVGSGGPSTFAAIHQAYGHLAYQPAKGAPFEAAAPLSWHRIGNFFTEMFGTAYFLDGELRIVNDYATSGSSTNYGLQVHSFANGVWSDPTVLVENALSRDYYLSRNGGEFAIFYNEGNTSSRKLIRASSNLDSNLTSSTNDFDLNSFCETPGVDAMALAADGNVRGIWGCIIASSNPSQQTMRIANINPTGAVASVLGAVDQRAGTPQNTYTRMQDVLATPDDGVYYAAHLWLDDDCVNGTTCHASLMLWHEDTDGNITVEHSIPADYSASSISKTCRYKETRLARDGQGGIHIIYSSSTSNDSHITIMHTYLLKDSTEWTTVEIERFTMPPGLCSLPTLSEVIAE